MPAKKRTWQAYFTISGSLIEWEGYVGADGKYASGWDSTTEQQVKETAIVMPAEQLYFGTLVVDGCRRGRSAAQVNLYNEDCPAQKFCMRLSEMVTMLSTKGCFVQYGKITGTFRVSKQGQNYGMGFVSGQPVSGAIPFLNIRNHATV